MWQELGAWKRLKERDDGAEEEERGSGQSGGDNRLSWGTCPGEQKQPAPGSLGYSEWALLAYVMHLAIKGNCPRIPVS